MDVVYGAANTWAFVPGGVPVWVSIGSHWRADDPIVAAFPSLFTPDPSVGLSSSVQATHQPRVFVGPSEEPAVPTFEQATAAPGEQRNVNRSDTPVGELEALRSQAAQLGVEVDRRWGVGRLTQEIEAAGGTVA